MSKETITILIVDDNASDRQMTEEMLASSKVYSFHIQQADRLAQCFKCIDKGGIDLIVLDLFLPESKGIKTLDKVLKRAPGIPILTLTRFADETTGLEAVGKGAQEYLVKGQFNKEMLCRSVYYSIERKKLVKELLIVKEAAEIANITKSEFLATMSHELRTPLNAIIGFSEILKEKTFGELNDRQTRYVTNILTSGQHLLGLINDILDLSKVEAGKMELELSTINVNSLLAASLIMIKEKTMKEGIKLDLQVAQAVSSLYIHADERKLKQIMYNLLSNAVKFTPKGGEIRIAAQLSQYEAIDPPSSITISVADTGIGIAPEDQERVFGKFEQIDSTYGRDQEGTGLGLALTRRLVEFHGGKIWVESQGQGKGSTFAFTIPCRINKEKEAAYTIEPSKAGDKEATVLVVEDDLNARELLSEYLTGAGYGVEHAFNGEDAIEMAKELKPFAITLDILLPRQDGFEVIKKLKALPETRDIPVIVVSIVEERQKGIAMGALQWFVKPIGKKILLDTLDDLLHEPTG